MATKRAIMVVGLLDPFFGMRTQSSNIIGKPPQGRNQRSKIVREWPKMAGRRESKVFGGIQSRLSKLFWNLNNREQID